MKHPALGMGLEEDKGSREPPGGFDMFSSAVEGNPEGRLENRKALYVGTSGGRVSVALDGSFLGFSGTATGEIALELKGTNFLKRIITVPAGEELHLSFRSRGSVSYVDDTVLLGEGSRLVYDGRFKNDRGPFHASVRAVHRGRDSASEVDVRGMVYGDAEVFPTGEVLRGARGASASVSSRVFVFGEGGVEAVPRLLVGEPDSEARHSFRKVRMTPEQRFYLATRGVEQRNIEEFYERMMFGD